MIFILVLRESNLKEYHNSKFMFYIVKLKMIRLKISDTHVFTEYCTEYRKLREKKIIKEKKPFIHFNYIYDHRTSFFFKIVSLFSWGPVRFSLVQSIVSAIVTCRGIRERVVNWLEQNRVNFLLFYRDCKANSSRA